jgi:hypothetical protein
MNCPDFLPDTLQHALPMPSFPEAPLSGKVVLILGLIVEVAICDSLKPGAVLAGLSFSAAIRDLSDYARAKDPSSVVKEHSDES